MERQEEVDGWSSEAPVVEARAVRVAADGLLEGTSLLTIPELAHLLQVSAGTVYDWHRTGQGPRSIKLGNRVRFDPVDVGKWLEELKTESLRIRSQKLRWAEETGGLKKRLKRHQHSRRW